MELVLTRQPGSTSQVAVICDGQPSHAFDLLTLTPNDRKEPPHPLDDPEAYGQAVYTALFPPGTPASRQLENAPARILLVTSDSDLDAVPWEYAYGSYGSADPSNAASSEGFLVLECYFVRSLPAEQRIVAPELKNSPHIIAVPANPLSRTLEPLNIDGEWLRLRAAIEDETLQDYAITLERTRPPTLARLGLLLTNQQNRVVHFMGHGGRHEKEGAILCFEKDNGDLDLVKARDFTRQVRGSVFLVTLGACASATPGETHFSNLAAALMRQKTPYALGMRFSIPDEDALTFSGTFYSCLVRGSSVEEAVSRVRLALSRSKYRPWMVGMPVLYTALSAPAAGFPSITGTPKIEEHQPHIEATALPRAEGAFQGRADDLKALGDALTGDARRRIVTIHGFGGQGKTTLAREAVERFAFAWPGGVWATTLQKPPAREDFVNNLARFLDITPDPAADPKQLERQVLSQLNQRRTLIVLDNAETLIDAVEAHDASTLSLAEFLKQLLGPTVSLLVTSRVQLGWPEEASFELGGLSPQEGAALFRQSAPQRPEAVDLALAGQLSERVDGHPLSLRLLGGAFNASSITLAAFLKKYKEQLVQAKNTFAGEQHRQRTLYASIDTSVRYLDEDLRHLLSGLWLFHAPFLPETAVQIFDPQKETAKAGEGTEGKRSPVEDHLHILWQRGLLNREPLTMRKGSILLYRLPPAMRPYIDEQFLARSDERETLLARFGVSYDRLVRFLYDELNRGDIAAALASLLREDVDLGAFYVTGVEQGYYCLRWGWILHRLGYRTSGLKLIEQASEVGEKLDPALKSQALANMATVYQEIGQPREALELYEQVLPLMQQVGDRAGEATVLNNMAEGYQRTGQPRKALERYGQVLLLTRALGDRLREATALANMATVYQEIGQLREALELYKQAMPLMQQVGDRAGEATVLNNMADLFRLTGQLHEALELYEQALQLRREVGDRAREATTLTNMAVVYQVTGQLHKALELYKQVLPLMREVGSHVGEATTLNGLAYLYQDMQRYSEAHTAFEQSIALEQQVPHPAGEIAGLFGLALLLNEHLDRPQEAINRMEQALSALVATGLPQDAAGHTREDLQYYLNAMRQGIPLDQATSTSVSLPPGRIHFIVTNTIAVMTVAQQQRAGWRESTAKLLQEAQRGGNRWRVDMEFFSAILDILDGKSPTLPEDHPYAQAIASIQEGIAAGGSKVVSVSDETMQAVREFIRVKDWEATRHIVEMRQAILFQPEVETLFEQNIAQAQASGDQRLAQSLELHLSLLRNCKAYGIAATFERIVAAQQAAEQRANLPFDAELIPRSIKALTGGPQEKMQHMQYLAAQASLAGDAGAKALINTIQLALFSNSLAGLGQDLEGVYRQAWDAIVAGVEQAGGKAS